MPTTRSRFEGFISPGSPVEFVGFSVVSAMLGLVSAGNPIGFAFVPLFAIAWWWVDRRRKRRIAAATRLLIHKEKPRPAKGLVLLLSPFSSQRLELKDFKVLNPRIDRLLHSEVTAADVEAMHLLESNLRPQIEAVDYHWRQNSLQEVWLIASETYAGGRGSEDAAEILEGFLCWQYGRDLTIHRQGLTVKDYDYRALWQLGEQIFREADYKDEAIAVDVTGGTKMMSVAIAMACIPPNRRMQYMDAQRDWQGNPIAQGELTPVAIDIDPILYLPD